MKYFMIFKNVDNGKPIIKKFEDDKGLLEYINNMVDKFVPEVAFDFIANVSDITSEIEYWGCEEFLIIAGEEIVPAPKEVTKTFFKL